MQKDAPLPFIPAHHAEVFVEDGAEDLQKFDRICCEIEEWDADGPDEGTQNIVNLSDWTTSVASFWFVTFTPTHFGESCSWMKTIELQTLPSQREETSARP